jgi:hypothetical protein
MRIIISALAILMCNLISASADPYRWCAEYGNRGGGGGTNCYFVTWEQCRAAISGNGGLCRPNLFYTGPDRVYTGPDRTAGSGPARR